MSKDKADDTEVAQHKLDRLYEQWRREDLLMQRRRSWAPANFSDYINL